MFFSKCAMIALLTTVMFLDLLFTLWFQPDHYWIDHTGCEERNPIGNAILSAHPNWFIVLFCFWLSLILFLVTKLPKPYNFIVTALALLGHAWGSSSWLHRLWSNYIYVEINDWYLRTVYCGVITAIMVLCIAKIYKAESLAKSFAED